MTPWYDYDQKPVRSGVYLTRVCIDLSRVRPHPWDGWCYWDGKRWAAAQATAKAAAHYRHMPSEEQLREWRGIETPNVADKRHGTVLRDGSA